MIQVNRQNQINKIDIIRSVILLYCVDIQFILIIYENIFFLEKKHFCDICCAVLLHIS